MLQSVVALCVRRRAVVLTLWVALLGLAVAMLPRLAIDAIPDVTNVQVTVITSSPGLSPEETEQYLTFPMETAMNGLPHVQQIRSISRAAVSSVTIVFKDEVNLWFARQMVSERLVEAQQDIPTYLGTPSLAPVTTGLGEIYQFYLTSQKRSPVELRTLLDWQIANALRSVPGVVEVNAMGGGVKQYQVIANPQRLAAHGVTLQQLCEALRRNNLNVGSGYIEKDMEPYVIRGQAQITNPEELGNIAITADRSGIPTLVKHVADIHRGTALRFGAVTKGGEGEIVAGTVMMLVGSNSRDVVERVKERLEVIRGQLPPDVQIHAYYDRAEFIGRTLHTVFNNLIEGALLVLVVLGVTLGSLRAAVVAAAAIPFSMALTVLLMIWAHVTGNLMSLGAIDFGLLVDGAIVMLEATLVTLAHGARHTRDEVAEVVAESMGRMARPVLFSLLIILLVYLPLMSLEGTEGKMFQPMAITIAFALASALLFSLTAAPALASFALPTAPSHGGAWLQKLNSLYAGQVRAMLARPARIMGPVAILVVVALVPAGRLGAEFLPRIDEGELLLDVTAVPGTGDWRVQKVLGLPALTIKPDRARLARYGMDAAEVLDAVEASRLGKNVGRVFEGNKRFDLMVLLPPSSLTPEGFGDLIVQAPSGQLLPLAAVADVTTTEGPSAIFREGLKRRVMVEVNVRGRDLVSYVSEAQRALADFDLPEGVTIKWGGQFENFTRAKDRLAVVVPVVVLIIFGMLFGMFGQGRVALAVFAAVPFAVAGGVVALFLRGLPFSLPAAVGFIAVGGVSVLNGVVMASRVLAELSHKSQDVTDAVAAGASEAFRPMLTTALVAAIGFLPMAMSTHAGSEVQRPLATVVIGGIVLSTLLTWVAMPWLLRLALRKS